jgi:hypothetical protein
MVIRTGMPEPARGRELILSLETKIDNWFFD